MGVKQKHPIGCWTQYNCSGDFAYEINEEARKKRARLKNESRRHATFSERKADLLEKVLLLSSAM